MVPTLTSLLTEDIDAVLAEARRNSLTRDNDCLRSLPAWFSYLRDHQRVAIREALTAYEEGAECVVLDAPTGSGKSLVGECVRRLLPGVRQTTYICSSKALQAQFLKDYPYAKVLQGRSNYPTELYPERFGGKDGLSTADCTKSPGESDSCLWCSNTSLCAYEQAKRSALGSELAVLNTSYFLSECNGPGRFSFEGSNGYRSQLIIGDESDTIESELMGHVEVRVSERRLKQYGLGVPKYVTKEESWIAWAEEAHAKVLRGRPQRVGVSDLVAIREAKRHTILLDKLRGLKEGLASGSWVYTGDRTAVAFKPVTVSELGQDKLWRHGDKWLLMSATVISADELLESLGWDDEKEWRLVKVPSTFKAENRKVVVWPVVSMTFKEKETAYPKMVEGVKEIVRRHPDERMLVHSVSYDLTKGLVGGLTELGATAPPYNPRPIITYTDSSGKDAALADFLASPDGILISPSMDRGIDLPGDQCRVQVICKIPYGNLRDKQVNARKYSPGGALWYNVQAIRKIVQMCGRATRSEDDWSVTYLLDAQFGINLYPSSKRLFPQWWRDALVWKTKGL